MRKLVIVSAVLMLVASTAYADYVGFNFNSLPSGVGSGAIGNYMTNVYGSQVNVDGAKTAQGYGFGSDTYLMNGYDGGYFAIYFPNRPIKGLYFQGHVFERTDGSDFLFRAFNDSHAIYTQRWNRQDNIWSGYIELPHPANWLRFSDGGVYNVGIDNLYVEPVPVPAPGALVLGVMGLGLVGWVKRRFA